MPTIPKRKKRVPNGTGIIHQREGECPACGSKALDYDKMEMQDTQIVSPYHCDHCGFSGQEWRKTVFTQHTNERGESLNNVELIAIGYEWICPFCERLNHEIETKPDVKCAKCKRQFTVSNTEHATG